MTSLLQKLVVPTFAIVLAMHRGANWGIPRSALGSAPEGAPGIRVLRRVLLRVLSGLEGAPPSALEGAQCGLITLGSTPRSTPNFPKHPLEHFPEHFQGFPS